MPKKAVEKPTEAKKGFHKWSKFDGSRFDGTFASADENPLAIDKGLIENLARESLDLRWGALLLHGTGGHEEHCTGPAEWLDAGRKRRHPRH